ncbi:hypothetical protein KIW84_072186 [Lathyrus oleraceus]|uniref:Uncharacterized protein n=1 Tax=Pisum sativum TaxID=3888 RepID=A0A9D4VMB2_PEA|nr:hypothetical protein KIW84_072186 [Pisum sativum]
MFSFSVRDNGYPRVAIIRDREKDRSDPDYDRSYGSRCICTDLNFKSWLGLTYLKASLGYGPPSTPIMSPFCTPGLNPTSGDGAYLQWPSPTMMYAHSYDQFRHAVYQVNHIYFT